MALNGVNLRQEKNSHDNVKDKFIQQIEIIGKEDNAALATQEFKYPTCREFTHIVKSVSMAKFSPEEVSALQAGGNESEKEPNASKRSSSFRLEFRTPNSSLGPYPKSDDKNLRYLYDESRSPRYAQKYSRNGGHIRSPIQIEVVDDRYKDDERRNRRLANIETKLKKTSSDDLKKVETVAAPLAEVSKEKAQPLKFIHKFRAHLLPRHRPPTLGSPCDSGSPGHAATTPSSRHHSTVATQPQHCRHTATTLLQNPQIATNDQPPQPIRQRHRT
ncbi:uncharacterized protein HKW66_Vig0089690 [Vigna angularis]|uniref:Uncharacterized protein n=1 Tax=Phaseolus angularis TaxID=3914 RepID=A0A8T0KFB0_PHAAN|nr:uncharacterized protein HKW66_Vig0089690 [Vigna angularis]